MSTLVSDRGAATVVGMTRNKSANTSVGTAKSALEATAPVYRRQRVPAAHTPGAVTRKEAKVLDCGARAASGIVEELFATHGLDVWRRPGIRVQRVSGDYFFPDAAGYLPQLDKSVSEKAAQVEGRPGFNVVFEFRSQMTSGSSSQKIPAGILDLANASDVLGVPAVMVLDTPALTDAHIRALKAEGRRHSVVVLTRAEITEPLLTQELVRVVRERARLLRRIGPRGGYSPTKRPAACEHGLAQRVSTRNANGVPLRKYGPLR